MNGWLLTAAGTLAGGVGTAVWGVATGPLHRRVFAQNLASPLGCAAVLLLAHGYGRPAYVDVGLLMALLGPVGTLVYARLLGGDPGPAPRGGRPLTLAVAAFTTGVTLAVAVATGPGRAAVKLLLVGALAIVGSTVASRALTGGIPPEERQE